MFKLLMQRGKIVCVGIFVHTICMCVYIYIYIMCMCIYIYNVYVYIYICICVYKYHNIYIYMYTHIHPYIIMYATLLVPGISDPGPVTGVRPCGTSAPKMAAWPACGLVQSKGMCHHYPLVKSLYYGYTYLYIYIYICICIYIYTHLKNKNSDITW